MPDTAPLTVRLDLTGNFSTGIGKAQRQLAGLNKSAGKVGKGFGQVAGGLSRAGLFVGGAAIAGLTGAAKAAIDFEDAFAGVKKTVNESDLKAVGLSFDALSKSFRTMATEIPIAATDFAKLGETAGALGVKAQDIETFVETTAKLGVTTNLTADQAADAFGRIGTILQFTGKDFTDFADTVVALGNAGASTESEITEIVQRFAAEAKAAGIATSSIAGLASATASLGFAPERGGTALARVFANMGTNISLANKKGQAFSKLTGRGIKDLQGSINKGQGLGIFLDVLKSIKGLSPVQANRTLKALGVTNTSDRTIFRTMAQNLPFVTEQLKIAANATGALGTEATKRFDTVASKIQLLKNNVIEAGITIGEGFAPAIGRAAEKLSAFLKQDENKSALRELGTQIGEAIDNIDWNEVLQNAKDFVGVMKTALSFTMRIIDALNKLPNEIKGAVAGFLVLNKLSGGLVGAGVGNIFGGLAGAAATGIASRAPGVGKLFAQPVFVTNFPPGFGAGGAGGVAGAAGKGIGALGKVFLVGEAIGLVAAVHDVWSSVNTASTEQATAIQSQTDAFIASKPTPEALRNALAGVEQGITDLRSNPLNVLVQGEALTKLEAMRASLKTAIGTAPQFNTPQGHGGGAPQGQQFNVPQGHGVPTVDEKVTTAVETLKGKIAADLGGNKTAIQQTRAQVESSGVTTRTAIEGTRAAVESSGSTVRSQVSISGANVSGSVLGGAASIVGAIWAARPDINISIPVSSTTVERKSTVINRYGTTGGSRWVDRAGNWREGGG